MGRGFAFTECSLHISRGLSYIFPIYAAVSSPAELHLPCPKIPPSHLHFAFANTCHKAAGSPTFTGFWQKTLCCLFSRQRVLFMLLITFSENLFLLLLFNTATLNLLGIHIVHSWVLPAGLSSTNCGFAPIWTCLELSPMSELQGLVLQPASEFSFCLFVFKHWIQIHAHVFFCYSWANGLWLCWMKGSGSPSGLWDRKWMQGHANTVQQWCPRVLRIWIQGWRRWAKGPLKISI